MSQETIDQFFAFARERHQIYMRRVSNEPWPWTQDPILRRFSFTNVFRELDKTTQWFRFHVRDKIADDPDVLLATVLFRWFNRVEVCEIIFEQPDLTNRTPWEHFRDSGDIGPMRSAIRGVYPFGPWVTGAYMIRSPQGMDKLDGISYMCQWFREHSNWRQMAEDMVRLCDTTPVSIENFTTWLSRVPNQGPFTAYEVACDLIYTKLLGNAKDRMTWANLGPGAKRGLHRIAGRTREGPLKKPRHALRLPLGVNEALLEMRQLLALSQEDRYWPSDWMKWDMRTVEHTLCEFDKYERVRTKMGAPRNLYKRTRGKLS